MPLNVGIIGYGRIGAEHAGWIARSRDARVAAIADATPARLEKARSIAQVFADANDLLADKSIDAVLVATPTAMHFEQGMSALAAGKHVMIEKPMALDLAQSRLLVDEARKTNRALSVFHNRRWDIDYLTLKSAIDSGSLGRVFNVESRIGQWSSCVGPAAREYRPGWRNEASFGGGGLYDWGSHFIDQMWRLLLPAKPTRVFAQLRGNVWTHDCDDFARVCIDFDTGAAAMIEINTTTTRPLPRWHVDTSAGSVDSPFSPTFDLDTWAQLDFTPADGRSAHRLPRAAAGLDETQIWERFAAAVRGEGAPAVSAQSVLPTMALLDVARASARSGAAIDLPEMAWTP